MKVYLWTDVFSDYTEGMAVVIAESVEDARELLAKKYRIRTGADSDFVPDDILKEPEEFSLDSPFCAFVFGGG